jgi:hypothetical protein
VAADATGGVEQQLAALQLRLVGGARGQRCGKQEDRGERRSRAGPPPVQESFSR